jgi:hypothetical protein
MGTDLSEWIAHPLGEQSEVEEWSTVADTFAGRVHIEWDTTAPVKGDAAAWTRAFLEAYSQRKCGFCGSLELFEAAAFPPARPVDGEAAARAGAGPGRRRRCRWVRSPLAPITTANVDAGISPRRYRFSAVNCWDAPSARDLCFSTIARSIGLLWIIGPVLCPSVRGRLPSLARTSAHRDFRAGRHGGGVAARFRGGEA